MNEVDELIPNDLAVNSTRNAVLQLQVHLGNGVIGENGSVRDITCKKNENMFISYFSFFP